ncbi:MAG: Ig-like domain repeat protein, partial [Actinobacteria bacterium]|nr:Ig-like domain repeat protein [Actinomycetota bacterium]
MTGAAAPAPLPTGTVTFTLFGPDDPTCASPSIFTSPARPLGGPPPAPPAVQATSGPFTPTAPGTYTWVATYSGDANYPTVTSPCGAPNEASVVRPGAVSIITAATGPVTLGLPISDTATVTGDVAPAPAPTGTVTFTLFGPGNPTCTGTPIFTSADRPLGGGPPPTALSADFTPTAAGTYNWVAVYSGDANYPVATSPCGAPGEASVVTPVPIIQVDKTVTPASRTAPGGDFTFTVVVTNTSNEVLTITSLTDDVYGDLTTRANSTCNTAIGTVLQPSPGPGNTYTCTFTAPFTGVAGASQTDVVTVHATNPTGVDVTDSDDAVVTLTPVPVIQVDKTVTPASRPAPGGDFTFTVVVTNNSNEVLTITSLTDDVYGDLTTRANSTCNTAIGTVLQPGGTYTCTFTAPFTGVAGASQTDVVTVHATNPTGVDVTDSDDAVVTLTPAPSIAVDKTATPLSRTAPGGDFTFNVVVTNTSNEVITITSLTDDIYGDLTTRANSTCNTAIGTALQPGGTYSCAFTAPFTGSAGSSQTDTVTVRGTNPTGIEVTDSDDAVVTLTPVPVIQVDKTATPLSRPEPGGDFTFNVVVTNTSNEVLTITALTDDVYGDLTTRANSTCNTAIGTVLQPGGTYSCAFTAPFAGSGGARQTDVVTVRATNPTGVEVTDSDDAVVFITNVAPAIHVDKTATPPTRPEPGGAFTFDV